LRWFAGSHKNIGVLKKRVLLGVALGILVAGLAAGCAGGEEPSKLNAMCEDFSARGSRRSASRTPSPILSIRPADPRRVRKAIADKVGTLKAPDEIADQADRLAGRAERQRDVLGELIDAATDNDFAEVRRLVSKNDALNKESNSIAREIGADACEED
jgi:hypothetical protein